MKKTLSAISWVAASAAVVLSMVLLVVSSHSSDTTPSTAVLKQDTTYDVEASPTVTVSAVAADEMKISYSVPSLEVVPDPKPEPVIRSYPSSSSQGSAGGSSGGVRARMEGIAASYGLSIRWVSVTGCGIGAGPGRILTGCYTEGTSYIEISARSDASSAYISDAVSHEITHALFYRKCGTVAPFSRYENVTEAYSDKYMFGSSGLRPYPYTSADVALADRVHNGSC